MAPWLRGWLPRYRFDALVGLIDSPWDIGPSERLLALHLLEEAWLRCSAHGFQQKLVAARLAALRTRKEEEEALALSVRRSMHRRFAQWHPRSGTCPNCRERALATKARCALRIGDDWAHYR